MTQAKQHDGDAGALAKVGTQVTKTLESTREIAGNAAHGFDANPFAALIGGLAIGAIVGSMVPRSEKERDLLAPAGQRVGAAGRAALKAAREAAGDTLTEGGINSENLRHQVANLFEQLFKAADNAGSAAVHAVREQANG